MKRFFLAIEFLTILPVKAKADYEKDLAGAMAYFPLVGLLLGSGLFGVNALLAKASLNSFLINTILVSLLVIITGGLHLDGLADTADAFFSRKDKIRMLEIMRDSSLGVMGVLSLIIIILMKLAVLSSLDSGIKAGILILMCVLSRYALVLAVFLFPSARAEGKAKVFIDSVDKKIFFVACSQSVIFSFILAGFQGLIVFGLVTLLTFILGRYIIRKINGITGDTLGAISELTEVFVLLTMGLIWVT